VGDIEQVGELTDKDLLDQMVKEAGHVAPPDQYETVDTYMARVRERGGQVSRNTALNALLRKVEAGAMDGCKMNVQGRQRWVFWPTNHRGPGNG